MPCRRLAPACGEGRDRRSSHRGSGRLRSRRAERGRPAPATRRCSPGWSSSSSAPVDGWPVASAESTARCAKGTPWTTSMPGSTTPATTTGASTTPSGPAATSCFVKLFEAEDDLTIRLLIDTSASMGIGGKLRQAARLAAALGFVGLARRDAVERPPLPAVVPARGASPVGPPRPTLLRHLEGLVAGGPTDVVAATMDLLAWPGPRGVTVLCSDLLTEGWAEALDRLPARGGDLVVAHVARPTQELRPRPPRRRRPGRLRDRRAGAGQPLRRQPGPLRARRWTAWMAEVAGPGDAGRGLRTSWSGRTTTSSRCCSARWREAGVAAVTFTNPAGWWLLALAIPILLAARPAPTTGAGDRLVDPVLWRRVERPVSSATPWQRLRPSWLLAPPAPGRGPPGGPGGAPRPAHRSALGPAHRVHRRCVGVDGGHRRTPGPAGQRHRPGPPAAPRAAGGWHGQPGRRRGAGPGAADGQRRSPRLLRRAPPHRAHRGRTPTFGGGLRAGREPRDRHRVDRLRAALRRRADRRGAAPAARRARPTSASAIDR